MKQTANLKLALAGAALAALPAFAAAANGRSPFNLSRRMDAMTNAVHKRNSNASKGLVLLSAGIGVALMAVAGALSVGTVAAEVDARYRVETASVDVNLCQQGLILTIR